jgi:hypothetical protein
MRLAHLAWLYDLGEHRRRHRALQLQQPIENPEGTKPITQDGTRTRLWHPYRDTGLISTPYRECRGVTKRTAIEQETCGDQDKGDHRQKQCLQRDTVIERSR